jgi:hypothetical protein
VTSPVQRVVCSFPFSCPWRSRWDRMLYHLACLLPLGLLTGGLPAPETEPPLKGRCRVASS